MSEASEPPVTMDMPLLGTIGEEPVEVLGAINIVNVGRLYEAATSDLAGLIASSGLEKSTLASLFYSFWERSGPKGNRDKRFQEAYELCDVDIGD